MKNAVYLVMGCLLLTGPVREAGAAKCLFINSYHQGYAWSDGVERGLRSVLEGRCELRQFDMDTKRNKGKAYKERIGLAAKLLIESWQPDVVITADDNAAKYVIKPYFRDTETPFVFGGVNWTAKEYGFPCKNVTGIVEVAPIKPMLKRAMSISNGDRLFYLGADTLTENKNLARFQAAAKSLDVSLNFKLVSTVDDWLTAYSEIQSSHDVVIMGSHSGIRDWQARTDHVKAEVAKAARKLSVTNHGWMMPFAIFGMTKVPEEHGEWTAQAALAILGGTPPTEIPVVANRKWDLWVNDQLLAASGINLPRTLRRRAKSVE